jgi:hypothetical protein
LRPCSPLSLPDGKSPAGRPASRDGIAYDEAELQKKASWFAVPDPIPPGTAPVR